MNDEEETTRMHFEATPVVWVSIASPDRKQYKSRQDHSDKARTFSEWLWKEKVCPFKTSSTGGGQWHGAFYPEDWPRVEKWLLANGFTSGPFRRFR